MSSRRWLTRYSLLTTTLNTSYNDSTVSANTSYAYKVRSVGSTGVSGFSSVDVATTIVFTDPALSSAIPIKGAHIEELRTAVAAMRVLAGLSASTFTDTPIIPQSTIIKRVHVTELRTALDAARSGIGLAPPAYTDGTITAGTTVMKAVHVSELRDGTQ